MPARQDETNRRIFEWLNPEGCWHEPVHRPIAPNTSRWAWECQKCDKSRDELSLLDNPRYDTFAGMEVLLKGLTNRGYVYRQFDTSPQGTSATLGQGNVEGKMGFSKAHADTLPLALCAAVLKLIQEETQTNG